MTQEDVDLLCKLVERAKKKIFFLMAVFNMGKDHDAEEIFDRDNVEAIGDFLDTIGLDLFECRDHIEEAIRPAAAEK